MTDDLDPPLEVFSNAMAASLENAVRTQDLGDDPRRVKSMVIVSGTMAGLEALREYMQAHDVLLGPTDEVGVLRWVPVIG